MNPTPADIDRIASLTDPVLRNLQITQCYHELSNAMAALTGPLANWCTFATWASKQAGQSIRKEDLARTFEDLLIRSRSATNARHQLRRCDLGSLAGSPPAREHRQTHRRHHPVQRRALSEHGDVCGYCGIVIGEVVD